MDFAVKNEEYEVIKGVPEELLNQKIESSATEGDKQRDVSIEDLNSFSEHPETISKNWIESILQETRPLAQWLNLRAEDFHSNCRGVAFVQCPLPHPSVDLSLEDQNITRNDYENQNSFALETALSRISKCQGGTGNFKYLPIDDEGKCPDIKTTGSYGIPPNVAIDNYCKQHAYSKARLLRTDRRELANELLEQMSESDSTEILVTHSTRFASPVLGTKAVVPTYKDIGRRNKTGENPPVRQNMFMEEPLKITPCVFFPSEVLIESRKGFIRRHKSVPRFTSK